MELDVGRSAVRSHSEDVNGYPRQLDAVSGSQRPRLAPEQAAERTTQESFSRREDERLRIRAVH